MDPLLLSESAQYDAVLCVKVADVDFDGENEVLIGTYGQVGQILPQIRVPQGAHAGLQSP